MKFCDRMHVQYKTNIDVGFASAMKRGYHAYNGNGDANLAPLDLVTPNYFYNNYFKNLIQRNGLLQLNILLICRMHVLKTE